MSIDAPSATLVAATIAAFAAMLNLTVTSWNARRAEDRAQYRLLLQPHVIDICDAMYQIVACTAVAVNNHDVGKARSTENWLHRASSATHRMKKLRLLVRFALPSLSEGMRVLTRVGNWVAHRKSDVAIRRELLDSATVLRERLEKTIRRAYLSGRPPRFWESCLVNRAASRVRRAYESEAGPQEAEENDELEMPMRDPTDDRSSNESASKVAPREKAI